MTYAYIPTPILLFYINWKLTQLELLSKNIVMYYKPKVIFLVYCVFSYVFNIYSECIHSSIRSRKFIEL